MQRIRRGTSGNERVKIEDDIMLVEKEAIRREGRNTLKDLNVERT